MFYSQKLGDLSRRSHYNKMIISISITVPAGTLPATPIRQEIKLAKGTLVQVTFDVPPGSNGEVYLRILHFENSIIPDMVDEWIPVISGRYVFNPQFSDWKNVRKVQLEGCAPYARYPHTIEVSLDVNEVGTLAELLKGFIGMGF